MSRYRMDTDDDAVVIDRGAAETQKQASVLGNRKPRKRRTGKTVPVTFRTTPAKKAQILRLAERLSVDEDAIVSLTEVIEHAIDVLEDSLKAGNA